MSKDSQQTDHINISGGPRTKAGKEKTRFNALKHGLYSAYLGSGSKHQRLRARLYRKIRAGLVSEIKPTCEIEDRYVDSATDALVDKDLVRRFQSMSIEHAMEKLIRAAEETAAEQSRLQRRARDLESDLIRLQEEKSTGLRWGDPRSVRDSFLFGVVRSRAGEEAAVTFHSMSSPDERKRFFYEVAKWDEATLWSYLVDVMGRALESHVMKADELAAQIERSKKNNDLELALERAALLSKETLEFILDSVNKCDRQFNRAIDSLIRYRESKAAPALKG
jgi:hypothetical protein